MLKNQFSCPTGYTITETVVANTIANLTTPDQGSILPTTPGDLKIMIKYIPKSKSPRPDGITNTALKRLPEKVLLPLTKNFNYCLRFKYFSKSYKT